MTPDERNIRSPHNLRTPEGCRAEADRVFALCVEDGAPPAVALLAWLDWMLEATLIDEEEEQPT